MKRFPLTAGMTFLGKEISPLFFTSCIIIAFFCFAFYLIWNQFLKKDTRLSTGLKVLRKKISELQNLSVAVESQMDRQSFAMNDKIQRLEYLLQKSQEVCQRMEKAIELASARPNKEGDKEVKSPAPQQQHLNNEKPAFSAEKSPNPPPLKAIHLKMLKNKAPKPKQPYFGESPFVKLGFVESVTDKQKNPSLDPSPAP